MQQPWQPVCGTLYEEYFLQTTGTRHLLAWRRRDAFISSTPWGDLLSWIPQFMPSEVQDERELRPQARQPQQEFCNIFAQPGFWRKGTSLVLHGGWSMPRVAGSASLHLNILWKYLIQLVWVWASHSLPHCIKLQCTAEYVGVLSEVRFWYSLGVGP